MNWRTMTTAMFGVLALGMAPAQQPVNERAVERLLQQQEDTGPTLMGLKQEAERFLAYRDAFVQSRPEFLEIRRASLGVQQEYATEREESKEQTAAYFEEIDDATLEAIGDTVVKLRTVTIEPALAELAADDDMRGYARDAAPLVAKQLFERAQAYRTAIEEGELEGEERADRLAQLVGDANLGKDLAPEKLLQINAILAQIQEERVEELIAQRAEENGVPVWVLRQEYELAVGEAKIDLLEGIIRQQVPNEYVVEWRELRDRLQAYLEANPEPPEEARSLLQQVSMILEQSRIF